MKTTSSNSSEQGVVAEHLRLLLRWSLLLVLKRISWGKNSARGVKVSPWVCWVQLSCCSYQIIHVPTSLCRSLHNMSHFLQEDPVLSFNLCVALCNHRCN
jgi:hypothetical protein